MGLVADWEWDSLPHPASLAYLAHGRSTDGVAELPEVVVLVGEGWHLVPDVAAWVFLPAIWPSAHKCWLPDRSTHYLTMYVQGRPVGQAPWSDALRLEMERELNTALIGADLPSRPPGRIWLVRRPGGFASLDEVLADLVATAEAVGVPAGCTSEFADIASQRLVELF